MTIDEVLDALETLADQILTEPNTRARNAVVTQFWGGARNLTPVIKDMTDEQRARAVAVIDKVTVHVFSPSRRKSRKARR